jgi:UDP-glucose 4-epimerase
MKILVTGALGHIGSQLIRDLPRIIPNIDIILVDNLFTQRYCSLFDLPGTGRYRFVEADILSCDLSQLLEGVDVLVHLAAVTDAASSFDSAALVERVNYAGTERVAQACAEAGTKLIFVSTTSVYGTQQKLVREDCPIDDLRPQSPYAESKLKAELMLQRLGETEGLRFVTLRFGTIFGISPGMRFHTAVNKFTWQACAGIPITVWRKAMDQHRPYLDLQDAVNAIGFVAAVDLFSNDVYNVLTLNATVREIVSAIQAHIDDLQVEYVDTRIMNQLSYKVCREKFEQTGFRFGGDLRARIHESIGLLRNIRSLAVADPESALSNPALFGPLKSVQEPSVRRLT